MHRETLSVANNILLRHNSKSSGGNSTSSALTEAQAQELFIGLGVILGVVLVFGMLACCIRNAARRAKADIPPSPLTYAV